MEMRAQGTAAPQAGPVLLVSAANHGVSVGVAILSAHHRPLGQQSLGKPFLLSLIKVDGDSDDDISSFGPYTSTTLWGPQGKNCPRFVDEN